METHSLLHWPQKTQALHIALFRDVTNADKLLQRIIALAQPHTTDEERQALDFVFIDARSVASTRHVLTGVTQALVAYAQAEENKGLKDGGEVVNTVRAAAAIKTRSVHAEVLYALAPTLTISESIKRFGLAASTTSLLVLHIGPSTGDPSVVLSRMVAAVQGQLALEGPRVLDLWRNKSNDVQGAEQPDWKTVCAAYRIAPPSHDDGDCAEDFSDAGERLESIVTSMVAMKSVAGS